MSLFSMVETFSKILQNNNSLPTPANSRPTSANSLPISANSLPTSANSLPISADTLPTSAERPSFDAAESARFRASSSQLARLECRNQFRTAVWNCSGFDEPSLLRGTREGAYISSLVSSATVHTVAQQCSAGQLGSCSCGRDGSTVAGDATWRWGGCSDNISAGEAVAEAEAGDRPLERHNSAAGRLAVRRSLRRMCKCHGVSGSCTLQTCWRRLGDFNEVGRYLRQQYSRAVQVQAEANGEILPAGGGADSSPQTRERRANLWEKKDKVKRRHLVYLQPSPDYCLPALSYPGVLGRTFEVAPTSENQDEEVRGCKDVCRACGLEWREEVEEEKVPCSCRFKWCCNVSCDSCLKKRIRITCVRRGEEPTRLITENRT